MKKALVPGIVLSMLVACTSIRKAGELTGLNAGMPAISTDFNDASKGFALPDNFGDSLHPQPLSVLPRLGDGSFQLAPGFFEMVCRSYCLHAGTHAPSSGDGYLAAPLKGERRDIIEALLRHSGQHPGIKQTDVQTLIWAVLAHANFRQLSDDLKIVSVQLLSPGQLFELNGGALGVIPGNTLDNLKARMPEEARNALDAENRLRELLNQGKSDYARFEQLAVLAGAAPADHPEYKRGRWCLQPDGFYIRFLPSGYTTTTVQVYCPQTSLHSSGSSSAERTLYLSPSGFPVLDLSSIVATPANTGAQRLGLGQPPWGGGGQSGGGGSGGSFGGGGSSSSYGDDMPPTPVHEGQKVPPPEPPAKKPPVKHKPPVETNPKPPENPPPDDTGTPPQTNPGNPDYPDNPGQEPDKPKPGDVDSGDVRKKLPDCFVNALTKFGMTDAQILEYFKAYNNVRCAQQFFKYIDQLLKDNPHGLTDCDAYALWAYTTNLFYRDLNKWLRDGTNPSNTKELTDLIDEGLSKLPNYPGKDVYRGIAVPPGDLMNFLAAYGNGAQNTWNNFTSCGGTENSSFAGRPAVNVIFIIEHSTGKDISAMADGIRCAVPPMSPPEILIKSHSTFKSTADPVFDATIGKWIIHLTQID